MFGRRRALVGVWFGPLTIRLSTLSAFLSLLAVALSANGTIFGPWTIPGAGRPVVEKRTFRVTDLSGRFVLRVTNKDVIHGLVAVNDQIVLHQRDFRYTGPMDRRGGPWEQEWNRLRKEKEDEDRRQKEEESQRDFRHDNRPRPVPLIERPITLRPGRNEIVVAFIGDRGSALTVEIIQKDAQPTDITPPTITTSATPDPNANGWNSSPVTVAFACSDADSGVAICPPPVTIVAEGQGQVVTGTAADQAGNTASATIILSIDRTAPVITGTPSPPANDAGWNNGPVGVTFSGMDTLSGIDPASVSAPAVLSNDGSNLSAIGQAADLAGNIGTTTVGGINIDQVPPAVLVRLVPPANNNGFHNGQVTVQFTCTDTGSGIATCPEQHVVSTEGEPCQ